MTDGQHIPNGFILFARKLLDSFLMEKPALWIKLWIWLLLNARFKDSNRLRRGQILTTIEGMREAMSHKIGYRKKKPTRDQIRRAYEAFLKASMITTTKTTRGMIITICNYDKYQNPKNYETHNESHNEDTSEPHIAPRVYKGRMKNNDNKGKSATRTPSTEEIKYPDWLNIDLWADFKKHRKALKKPLNTKRSETLNINRLKGLIDKGYSQEEIVNLSIEMGWNSFYEPKINQGNRTTKSTMRIYGNMNAMHRAKELIQ